MILNKEARAEPPSKSGSDEWDLFIHRTEGVRLKKSKESRCSEYIIIIIGQQAVPLGAGEGLSAPASVQWGLR